MIKKKKMFIALLFFIPYLSHASSLSEGNLEEDHKKSSTRMIYMTPSPEQLTLSNSHYVIKEAHKNMVFPPFFEPSKKIKQEEKVPCSLQPFHSEISPLGTVAKVHGPMPADEILPLFQKKEGCCQKFWKMICRCKFFQKDED